MLTGMYMYSAFGQNFGTGISVQLHLIYIVHEYQN